ncbi:MAG: hypothetical protein KJ064_27530 [Anaerolineae bacterium]|nr:hypothetical protein [Anaerolineae bacterium]
MSHIYLTGTRHPGAALRRFVPDFVEMLLDQGHQIITSNKKGVDEVVIAHCEQQNLPLKVCAFLAGHNFYQNRHVQVEAENVRVQKVYSPTWLRFRHLAELTEKMVFLHAGKTRGALKSIPTIDAFAAACEKRGIAAEQLIVQHQYKTWIAVTELRNAPTIGAAHIYIYARQVPGLDGIRHCVAQYRIESWRQVGEVIQPGIGRREFIIPDASREAATLKMLIQALMEMETTKPERLIIHSSTKTLPALSKGNAEVTELLQAYPQVVWKQERQSDLLNQIGAPISKGQQLWNHTKIAATYRGLYQ